MEKGHFTWLVKPIGYQSITKRCPGCLVRKLFYPSGCFRVNAQKKTLDVWNIYKCEKCDYTWNIALFSRINTHKLDPELHNRFLHNNPDLVRHYAYDYAILKKNSAEPGPVPVFQIMGDNPCELNSKAVVHIRILFEHAVPVRLMTLLTSKLSLSRGEVSRLIEHNAIQGISRDKLTKKLKRPLSFQLDLARFHQLVAPIRLSPSRNTGE